MTIEKTREILGEEIKDLSDKEVEDLIAKSSVFCDAILDTFERIYAEDKGRKQKNR